MKLGSNSIATQDCRHGMGMSWSYKSCIIAFVLQLSFVLCATTLCVTALANEGDQSGESDTRSIAIAYDNSGSMFEDTRWNAAQYSVEVMAAMLDQGDTLAIFTMDEPGVKVSVSGGQEMFERVKQVHGADLGYSEYTDTRPAQEAYDYLKTSTSTEKWLVITTDGEFNQGGTIENVQGVADQAAADGIQVIYLAIGDNASAINEGSSGRITVKRAGTDSVLSSMTEVINQVFGRATLPADCLDMQNSHLSLDVPMSQVVVFAQGEDVSVGDLSQEGDQGATVRPNTVSVSHSEALPEQAATRYPSPIDDSLQGVVATFDSKMPAGDYRLDISGAASASVYYVPYVDIAVSLTGEDGVDLALDPDAANSLYAGTYKPSFVMLDPFSNEVLSSPLLDPATYSLRVSENGDVQDVGEDGSFTLTSGSADFDATVETVGGARATQSYWGVEVGAAPVPLSIDASAIPDDIPVASFPSTSYPVKVTHTDGSALTPEEWSALEPSVVDDSGVVWTATKDDANQSVTVQPTYGDGDEWATETKLFGFTGFGLGHSTDVHVRAQSLVGDSLYSGEDVRPVNFTPDLLSALLHDLWWLILLAFAIFLIVGYIVKPRLPRKMMPSIYDQNTGGKLANLNYSDSYIRNKFMPYIAETVSFSLNTGTIMFSSVFQLASIGLVASKKKKGRRRFYIDEATVEKMKGFQNNPGSFPAPQFKPVSLDRVPGTILNAGSSLSITGKNLNQRKRQSVTYILRFGG